MSENIYSDNGKDSVAAENNKYRGMNFIQRVFGIIISPEKVMKDLEQKPRILFALLLTLFTPVVLIFSVFPMYMEYSRTVMEATYAKMNMEVTAEMMEAAVATAKYTGPIGGALGAAGMWFLGALLLWLVIKIFKGQGTYKQILSIIGYSSVIGALAAISSIVTTLITGTYSELSFTSIAVLLPDMKGNFIYGAAKAIDVFSIWQYAVLAIGTAVVSKLSKKKAYIIVSCIFAAIVIYTGFMEVASSIIY